MRNLIEKRLDFYSGERKSSIVNQLTVQIQELQDKVNSLNDSIGFYDPETARSSGLSRVPNQPMSIPNLRGLIGRDSCLQPDTRDSSGKSGNFFEECTTSNFLWKFEKHGISTLRTRVT